MRKLLSLFTMLLVVHFSYAQQRQISGTVTGKTDKTPLAGVSKASQPGPPPRPGNGNADVPVG